MRGTAERKAWNCAWYTGMVQGTRRVVATGDRGRSRFLYQHRRATGLWPGRLWTRRNGPRAARPPV